MTPHEDSSGEGSPLYQSPAAGNPFTSAFSTQPQSLGSQPVRGGSKAALRGLENTGALELIAAQRIAPGTIVLKMVCPAKIKFDQAAVPGRPFILLDESDDGEGITDNAWSPHNRLLWQDVSTCEQPNLQVMVLGTLFDGPFAPSAMVAWVALGYISAGDTLSSLHKGR